MSIRLNANGSILIAGGGNPAEDSDCCCETGAGCEPCAFRIESGLDQLSCGSCEASGLSEWDGSFCIVNSELYRNHPQFGPCAEDAILSINGMALGYSTISLVAPGTWYLTIGCYDAACNTEVLWQGGLSNATPDGVYSLGFGCSGLPATFTVIPCS